MPHMHPQRHLWLFSISTKMPFTDQQSQDETRSKRRGLDSFGFAVSHCIVRRTNIKGCFTVMYHVKPSLPL